MSNVQIISGYQPGAIGRIVELHGTYYHEYWDMGLYFEARVATELAEFLLRFDAAHDNLWLALCEKSIVGAIAIDSIEASTRGARLRWFILAPEVQSQGIGKRLIQEAMHFCQQVGFHRIYLTTFAGLDAARHLYEQWGFRLCEEAEGAHWGKTVVEQVFELRF